MVFNRNNIYTVFIFLFFASAFFSRCAQPAVPTGGPIDTLPPMLLSVSPANFSTNFKSREIHFRFNEYLQLKDVQKEILISPPMNPRPIFSLKGKSVVVKFPPELELYPNTTYKIDFGSAIRDNNEGNAAKRFEYIFSTGPKIDSLVMSGKLVDVLTGLDIVNGFVLYFADTVYSSNLAKGDSTIFIGKKLSIARTDSTGNFLATNLKGIPYRIFAIKDENGNQEYDMGSDLVGLLNNRFNPATMKEFDVWIDPIKDKIEVTPQVKIELFKEERKLKQSLKEITRPKEFMLQMIFAGDSVVIESIKIDSVLNDDIIIENNTFNDSIKVWLRTVDTTLPDTLKGVIRYQSLDSMGAIKIDSSKFALNFIRKEDMKSGADKVAEKLSDFSNKFFDGVKRFFVRLFMGKKKKIAIKAAEYKVFVADSLKKVTADSLAMLRADSLAALDTLKTEESLDEILSKTKRDSVKVFRPSFIPSGDVAPTVTMYLSGEYPIYKLDTANISVTRLSFPEKTEDSFDLDEVEMKDKKPTIRTKEKYTLKQSAEDFTKWLLDINLKPKSEYEITVNQDAIMDIRGYLNDSTTTTVKTFDPEKYSRVVVDIKIDDSLYNDNFIIKLVDSTNNVLATKTSHGEEKVIFDYVPAKTYKLLFIDDRNGNKKQDIGNIFKNIEPEGVEIYQYKNGVSLFLTKENNDYNIEVRPQRLFNDIEVVKSEAILKEEEKAIKTEKEDE